MKRRYRIVKPIRFFVFVLLLVLTITFSSMTILKLSQASASSRNTYKQIEIHTGDTLWEIASNYCPNNIDIREYVSEICETNDINANNISPGNVVFVPLY